MSNHLEIFGLARAPFEGRSADALLLETGPLRRAASWIRNELQEGTAIVAVAGSRGVGKTCMAMALPHLLGGRVARILDATVGWGVIQEAIAEQLGLPDGQLGRSALLERRFAEAGRLAVVIDDAEQLQPEACAAVRGMIANANEPGGTLLHCILLADPEHCTVRTPAAGWVQGAQPRIELAPMLARELQRYVEARLDHAGWQGGELFSEPALDAVHRLSGGFPRTANRICEQALVEAARAGRRSIDQELIEGLGLRPRPKSAGARDEATEPGPRAARRSARTRDDLLPTARSESGAVGSSARWREQSPAAPVEASDDGANRTGSPTRAAGATPPARRPERSRASRERAAPRRAPEARTFDPPSPAAPHSPGLRPASHTLPGGAGSLGKSPTASLSAALRELAARVSAPLASHGSSRLSGWKLPALLVGAAAALLLAGQVVRTSRETDPAPVQGRPVAGELRASDVPGLPEAAWQGSPGPAPAPTPEWISEPAAAAPQATDGSRPVADEVAAGSAREAPPETASGGAAEAASEEPDGPAEAASEEPDDPAERVAPAQAPPVSKARSGSRGLALDDLDLSLDAEPTASATRTPRLALPEPDLARRLSPAGPAPAE